MTRDELVKHAAVRLETMAEPMLTPEAAIAAVRLVMNTIEASGHAIVPVEPTDGMLDSALETDTWMPQEIWPAMIEAGKI